MQGFIIFVEGVDTDPAKLPVYVVDSEEHATLLCEGMKETDYAIFDFSIHQLARPDRGKLAFWLNMICDARRGVYGNIVGGIHDMIDGAYYIMTGHRFGGTIASGADTETVNGGSATQSEQDETTDDYRQPPKAPSRRPPQIAFLAWFTRDVLAVATQQQIADEMTRQGSPATQGQVSKWLAAVEEYQKAGGIMPTLNELNKPNTDTVDPAVIDIGTRQDGLTPRQRLRPSESAD